MTTKERRPGPMLVYVDNLPALPGHRTRIASFVEGTLVCILRAYGVDPVPPKKGDALLINRLNEVERITKSPLKSTYGKPLFVSETWSTDPNIRPLIA